MKVAECRESIETTAALTTFLFPPHRRLPVFPLPRRKMSCGP